MSRVMNCLSEDETKELLVEAKKKEEKYMEKASNSCRPSRVQNEDSDDDSSGFYSYKKIVGKEGKNAFSQKRERF